jgi:hypothetical protein
MPRRLRGAFSDKDCGVVGMPLGMHSHRVPRDSNAAQCCSTKPDEKQNKSNTPKQAGEFMCR